MVFLNIDYCEECIHIIKGTNYGRFLSFRFLEGQIPVMNIGHNEFIFKQYIFSQIDGQVLLGKIY